MRHEPQVQVDTFQSLPLSDRWTMRWSLCLCSGCSQVTGAVGWRREGIKYKKNEVRFLLLSSLLG